MNPTNNLATIYHGIISQVDKSPQIKLNFINDSSLEFGYPSLAYTGNDLSENESIILFNHTSNKVFPGVSAIFYNNGNYSNIFRIKQGEAYVNVQAGKKQRWGDYTGLQRKYNDSGTVWGSGYWGKIISPANPSYLRVCGTWITALHSPTNFDSLKTKALNAGIKDYPNPVSQMYHIEFYSLKAEEYYFYLYDSKGIKVKYLFHEWVKEGKNSFSFNLEPLRPGIYFLYIVTKEGKVTKKKILKT